MRLILCCMGKRESLRSCTIQYQSQTETQKGNGNFYPVWASLIPSPTHSIPSWPDIIINLVVKGAGTTTDHVWKLTVQGNVFICINVRLNSLLHSSFYNLDQRKEQQIKKMPCPSQEQHSKNIAFIAITKLKTMSSVLSFLPFMKNHQGTLKPGQLYTICTHLNTSRQ
jgi:hypothetical protein